MSGAEDLAAWLSDTGVSLAELSRRTGTTRSQLRKWRDGVGTPGPAKAETLELGTTVGADKALVKPVLASAWERELTEQEKSARKNMAELIASVGWETAAPLLALIGCTPETAIWVIDARFEALRLLQNDLGQAIRDELARLSNVDPTWAIILAEEQEYLRRLRRAQSIPGSFYAKDWEY